MSGEEKIEEAILLKAENHCINGSEVERETGICRRTLKRKLKKGGLTKWFAQPARNTIFLSLKNFQNVAVERNIIEHSIQTSAAK